MTIDLLLVNAGTKTEQWSIPIAEAELGDFKGSSYFALWTFVGAVGNFILTHNFLTHVE